jgi:predicted nucleotidyltransferase
MEKINYEKVLGVFFDNPTKRFYVREIARITELNPNTILNICSILEKDGLLKREKKKHIVEFYAIADEKFKRLKRINNFSIVSKSGLIEFLNSIFSPEAVSLIGSYSRGEDIKDSDIDIVVISKKDYSAMNLKKFEKVLNRKIHVIVTYYNKLSDEFYINLINGMILSGYINKK